MMRQDLKVLVGFVKETGTVDKADYWLLRSFWRWLRWRVVKKAYEAGYRDGVKKNVERWICEGEVGHGRSVEAGWVEYDKKLGKDL